MIESNVYRPISGQRFEYQGRRAEVRASYWSRQSGGFVVVARVLNGGGNVTTGHCRAGDPDMKDLFMAPWNECGAVY